MTEKMNIQHETKMYQGVKTSNAIVGCYFGCSYCAFRLTVQRIGNMKGGKCKGCMNFTPHEHLDRLNTIPSASTIFLFGHGDISFYRPQSVKKVLSRVRQHSQRCPHKQFYVQTKDPACLNHYLPHLPKGKTILVITLETNRDAGYHKVSKAPLPSKRYNDFKAIPWHRKIVTIEPVMDFDHDKFLEWIKDINPEAIYIGYNSRPKKAQLPEPSKGKLETFIQAIEKAGIQVKRKDMR